jgi:MFS family permease
MPAEKEKRPRFALTRRRAILFIVLLGVTSLFSDMTYEGARSIAGPYLGVLGATATVVGIVSGLGELLGYLSRLVSGTLSDRTKRYWAIAITGYAVNLFAVPLLALAGSWQLAALLLIVERTGRGIRSPVRDAMLSHASTQTGLGWGFGLHQALDQTGAVLGPLAIAAVLYSGGAYRIGFALLLLPAGSAITMLLLARFEFPQPRDFDLAPPPLEAKGLPPVFRVTLLAVAFVAAGYADFPLVAYHFASAKVMPAAWVPLLFALANAVDGASGLLLGSLYDRLGIVVMILATLLSALAAPLVFLGGFAAAALGMGFWGVGMGAQESVMRAAIAHLAPADRRATAFGIFNAVYGVAWFGGSTLLGILYDYSIMAVAVVSLLLQAASLPVFLWLAHTER